jgi:hypothetical protein
MQLAPKHGYRGWARAAIIAVLVTGVSVIGLVVVPDVIVERMSASAVQPLRDGVVLAWTVAFFAVAAWAFVRAQGGSRGVEVTEVTEVAGEEEVAA